MSLIGRCCHCDGGVRNCLGCRGGAGEIPTRYEVEASGFSWGDSSGGTYQETEVTLWQNNKYVNCDIDYYWRSPPLDQVNGVHTLEQITGTPFPGQDNCAWRWSKQYKQRLEGYLNITTRSSYITTGALDITESGNALQTTSPHNWYGDSDPDPIATMWSYYGVALTLVVYEDPETGNNHYRVGTGGIFGRWQATSRTSETPQVIQTGTGTAGSMYVLNNTTVLRHWPTRYITYNYFSRAFSDQWNSSSASGYMYAPNSNAGQIGPQYWVNYRWSCDLQYLSVDPIPCPIELDTDIELRHAPELQNANLIQDDFPMVYPDTITIRATELAA